MRSNFSPAQFQLLSGQPTPFHRYVAAISLVLKAKNLPGLQQATLVSTCLHVDHHEGYGVGHIAALVICNLDL